MKTVQLTPDEVSLVEQEIRQTATNTDHFLRRLNYTDPNAKERDINKARTAESILKKLEAVK